jgi:pimeloyl-ACP methyl ester carboxylesterase
VDVALRSPTRLTSRVLTRSAGKFQHVVLQHCGHHIQQDDPRRLAELVVDFYRRARGGGVDLSKIRKVGQ